ncbi:MAG TPA: nucleoside-diphosphate sugar epimerase/dehydratase, partial [Candidatus Thermoplasmatota archaeon]|nr:nucleoside-diphosphate sugar epimerase/dehydratase [Candidatus Thermoplasmatota archaeon]
PSEDASAATRARRAARLAFFVVGDAMLVVAGVWAGLALRYDGAVPAEDLASLRVALLLAVPATLLFLRVFGAYSVSWSFVGLGEIARIALAVLVASFVLGSGVQFLQATREDFSFPRSVAIIQAPLTFLAIASFRLSKRAYMAFRRPRGNGASDRALLVGGGDTGAQVLRSIHAGAGTLAVVGFLDDDPLARGTTIHGVKVIGPVGELEMHVRRLGVGTVVLCVPAASGPFIRDVVQRCRAAGVKNIRIVPPLREVVDGRASWKMTREVRLEDLLGRDTVEVIHEDLDRVVRGRRVVVTGGAGTIGSELCRQILRLGPAKLFPLDVDETRLHDLGEELRAIRADVPVEEALVDVRDRGEVERFFRTSRPGIVFHAAAYKHVPMMERWPVAALHTNVIGTSNVLEGAAASGVKEFVLVSTDKAVEPSSVMGATKRLAEVVTFGREPPPGMACAAVRFGNVIGSRGSVIPTFERQLRRGGPITVTHPDIERYFMMTSEAVLLVLHAAAMAKGRDVFVLDMGKPVRILDVAREFVRLNGMEPDKDIPIVFTGLRPGEKLTEILHYPEEQLGPTRHPRIARAEAPPLGDATALLAEVAPIVEVGDTAAAQRMLRKRFSTLVFDTPKA